MAKTKLERITTIEECLAARHMVQTPYENLNPQRQALFHFRNIACRFLVLPHKKMKGANAYRNLPLQYKNNQPWQRAVCRGCRRISCRRKNPKRI